MEEEESKGEENIEENIEKEKIKDKKRKIEEITNPE